MGPGRTHASKLLYMLNPCFRGQRMVKRATSGKTQSLNRTSAWLQVSPRHESPSKRPTLGRVLVVSKVTFYSKALLCSVEAGWDDIMIMTHVGLASVNFNVGKQTLTAFRFPGRSLWVCLGRAAEQKLLYTLTRNLKCWKWGWKASPRTPSASFE